MKNKIVLILSVFAVMVLSVLSVYGITEQGREVEKAYASVPDGYVLVQNGVDYGDGYIYIDTSVTPNLSTSNQVFYFEPYDGIVLDYVYSPYFRVSANYIWLIGNDRDYETSFYDVNSGWDSSIVSQLNEVRVTSISSSSASYVNTWFYFKEYSSTPVPVTQSTTVTFNTAQIDSLIFDGLNFTTTGQSQEIAYDDEDEYYTLSVTPKNGYKVTYAVVEYLNDADNELPARYQISNDTAQIACPVGDAITSITIDSEPISVGVLSYLQTWFLNSEDNYIGTIDYLGSSGTYVLPSFTISFFDEPFMDFIELYNYVYSLISTSQALFEVRQYNITGCVYLDGSAVSFPLTASNYDSSRGGILFTTKRIQSSTAFSAPSVFAYLSDFGDTALPLPIGGYDFTTPFVYSVAPYALSSNSNSYDWYIVLREGSYPTGAGSPGTTNVHLYIDNQLIDYFTCDLAFNASIRIKGINLAPVSSFLSDLSNSNGIVYYLDNVIYDVSSPGNVTELYFSSNQSNWSPSVLDAFSYLGQIFDNVFDILDLQITRDITLGTILLIVLSLGVLLFIFRISGVF